MQRVTVFEVAASAKVSLATVDRVLNGRKGVRPATIERVQAAVERLGFRRDSFAAGLATQRRERYAFVLPARGTNSFISGLHDAVADAAAAMADRRVTVRAIDYAAFDEAALAAVLAGILPIECDGVAVVAMESPLVRTEIDRLVGRDVAVVTVVSDVSPSRRQQFVGIDNKAAGRTAAALIGRMAPDKGGSVGLIVGEMTLHDHADRRLGFEQVMRREFPGLHLLPTIEGRDDSVVTQRLAGALLREHADLVGLYSAGAGNRGIVAALREDARQPAPIVVAHELTAATRDALLSGTITVILHQNQEQEVACAIAALRGMRRIEAGTAPRPVQTQIFLRDNIP